MCTVGTLFEASRHVYELRTNRDASQCQRIGDFELLDSSYDPRTGHGAAAYYNHQSRELVIAHRGSVFSSWKDIKADMQIGLHEHIDKTNSDISALCFSNEMLERCEINGYPIVHAYFTGHSKGGHEAQICTAVLARNPPPPCSSVTFNAPGISSMNVDGGEYPHVNLRVDGSIIGDQVSKLGGAQLGKGSLDIPTSENGVIKSHLLSSVGTAIERFQIADVEAKSLIQAYKEGGPDAEGTFDALDVAQAKELADRSKAEFSTNTVAGNPEIVPESYIPATDGPEPMASPTLDLATEISMVDAHHDVNPAQNFTNFIDGYSRDGGDSADGVQEPVGIFAGLLPGETTSPELQVDAQTDRDAAQRGQTEDIEVVESCRTDAVVDAEEIIEVPVPTDPAKATFVDGAGNYTGAAAEFSSSDLKESDDAVRTECNNDDAPNLNVQEVGSDPATEPEMRGDVERGGALTLAHIADDPALGDELQASKTRPTFAEKQPVFFSDEYERATPIGIKPCQSPVTVCASSHQDTAGPKLQGKDAAKPEVVAADQGSLAPGDESTSTRVPESPAPKIDAQSLAPNQSSAAPPATVETKSETHEVKLASIRANTEASIESAGAGTDGTAKNVQEIRDVPAKAADGITNVAHPKVDLVDRGNHLEPTPMALAKPEHEKASEDLITLRQNYNDPRTTNPRQFTAAENVSESHVKETREALDKLVKNSRFKHELGDRDKIGQVEGIDMHVSKYRDALYSRNPSTGNIQHHVGNRAATDHEAAMYLQSRSQTVQTGGQNSSQAMTDAQRSEGSKFQPEKPRQHGSYFEMG